MTQTTGLIPDELLSNVTKGDCVTSIARGVRHALVPSYVCKTRPRGR